MSQHGQLLAVLALEAVLETAPMELYLLREDGRLIHASPTARNRFSASPDLEPPELFAAKLPGAVLRWLPPVEGVRYALVRGSQAKATEDAALARAREDWKLTRRQAEVLGLLAQGHSNRLIASTLTCSERTVELHIASLFKKADCDSRTALVAKFWRAAQ